MSIDLDPDHGGILDLLPSCVRPLYLGHRNGRMLLAPSVRTVTRLPTLTIDPASSGRPERSSVSLALPGSQLRDPYTGAEIDRLREVAAQQPTRQRGRTATAFLALGLGAGLRPPELLSVAAEHVQRLRGVVVISVPGELARDVPVRRRGRPHW